MTAIAVPDSEIQQVVTVGKSGDVEYTVIQDAIDSITDNAANKPYVVQIYPGDYPEDITMEDWVSLKGMGSPGDVIISGTNSAPLITFDADTSLSTIENLTLKLAPTITGQSLVSISNGYHFLRDVELEFTSSTNDIAGTMVAVTGGSFYALHCRFVYTLSGTHANVKTHDLISVSGIGTFDITHTSKFEVDVSDQNDNLNVVNDASTSTLESVFSGNIVEVNLLSGSYSGTTTICRHTGAAALFKSCRNNHLHAISAGNGTGYCYYLDSGGNSGQLHSLTNDIKVTGFTTNYLGFVDVTDTLSSQFDSGDAVDLVAGTGDYRYANSPIPTEFYAEYVNAYHIGVGTFAAGTGHLILGQEHFTGFGNKVGIGMFPAYTMTVANTGNLYGLQGNVFFGGAAWTGTSYINGLQFYPAPDYQYGSVAWGNANLNIIGITTGALINIFGRTITANALVGLSVTTLAHIFGAPGAVSAPRASGIVVDLPANGSGTIVEQCGIELRKQAHGTTNIGAWLQGEGLGADIAFGRGTVVSGTGDTLSLGAFGTMTITDTAAAFTPAMVGRAITIAGAAAPGNNGTFVVSGYVSATQITYVNTSGANQAVWLGTWSFPGMPPNARMYYDGADLIVDPDIVGTGRVLIGTTGDDDMLLNDIEIDGDINHDGTLAGFFSAAPVAQQSITGALSTVADAPAKAVLTSLIAMAVNLGLGVDNTT